MSDWTAGRSIDESWVISIEGLSKAYKIESSEVHALRQVDLRVRRGEMRAIVGKSGAGKSTLLHVVGLLDKPTSGKYYLKGASVADLSDKQASLVRNAEIGFVFQMNNLLSDFSALENVMMPGLIAGVARKLVQDRARFLLSKVGLEQRALHRPGELSGGEQQRVAIARALVMSPSIILADEPTGNLDQRNSEIVEQFLFDLCRENQVTMLLVTHDGELAKRFPGRVVMEDEELLVQTECDFALLF